MTGINSLKCIICWVVCGVATTLNIEDANAQNRGYPVIGNTIPSFQFKVAHGSSNEPVIGSSKDLLGDFYILDFWSTGCGSCIASFPKLNQIQERFKGKVKIILVGLQTKHEDIEKAFLKYKAALKLDLVSAYDSSLFTRFVPRAIPHLIWVDDTGIVKAITDSDDLSEKNVELFINHRPFDFRNVSAAALLENSVNAGGEIDKGGSTAFRSELRLLKSGAVRDTVRDLDFYLKDIYSGYRARSATALALFKIAFLGKVGFSLNQSDIWPWPIIETDTGNTATLRPGEFYDYFLELPSSAFGRQSIMEIMQRDLQTAFNVEANVIKQMMPYYELVITNPEKVNKLKYSMEPRTNSWNVESNVNHIVNTPISSLPITLNNKLLGPKILMTDGTKDTSQVSLSIEANILHLESIRAGLRKLGMDLVRKRKEMLVLKLKI